MGSLTQLASGLALTFASSVVAIEETKLDVCSSLDNDSGFSACHVINRDDNTIERSRIVIPKNDSASIPYDQVFQDMSVSYAHRGGNILQAAYFELDNSHGSTFMCRNGEIHIELVEDNERPIKIEASNCSISLKAFNSVSPNSIRLQGVNNSDVSIEVIELISDETAETRQSSIDIGDTEHSSISLLSSRVYLNDQRFAEHTIDTAHRYDITSDMVGRAVSLSTENASLFISQPLGNDVTVAVNNGVLKVDSDTFGDNFSVLTSNAVVDFSVRNKAGSDLRMDFTDSFVKLDFKELDQDFVISYQGQLPTSSQIDFQNTLYKKFLTSKELRFDSDGLLLVEADRISSGAFRVDGSLELEAEKGIYDVSMSVLDLASVETDIHGSNTFDAGFYHLEGNVQSGYTTVRAHKDFASISSEINKDASMMVSSSGTIYLDSNSISGTVSLNSDNCLWSSVTEMSGSAVYNSPVLNVLGDSTQKFSDHYQVYGEYLGLENYVVDLKNDKVYREDTAPVDFSSGYERALNSCKIEPLNFL